MITQDFLDTDIFAHGKSERVLLREKEDSNRDQQSRAKPEPASHLFGKYQNTHCQEGRLEKQRNFQMPIAQEPYRGEKRRINRTAMAPTTGVA